MHEGGFFYQALVYLAAAVVSVPVAKKLGLGSVLGYLIAGILIGPFALGFVGAEGQDIMHFAEFGVVMMLFLIGLELEPSMIWRMRAPILGSGGIQVGLTTLLIAAAGLAFGLPWQTALAIGLILALSSTAIVLQSLKEKGLMDTTGGRNAFSVLLFQDIAVIPILALLPLLAIYEVASVGDAHHDTFISHLPIWGQTMAVLMAVGGIILLGQFLIGPFFRMIAKLRLREMFTASALLLVVAIAVLMTQVGLSPALGTFLAGVTLAQSEYRHELETDIDPFKGLLLGLFFIAVGASIDFNLIAEMPQTIFALVGLLILIKFGVLFALSKFSKMGLDNGFLFSFSLAQGGEFGFVLFSFATQNGIVTPDVANPLIAVVAISMALTPLLMLVNEMFIQPRFGTTESSERETDKMEERNSVIIAGFGRYGSTVGRLLQSNGVQSTYLDVDPDNVDLLRKMGLEVFYGDASRADLLHAAGAEEAKLIVVAVNEPAKTQEIIETAKKNFPHLQILARTRGWSDSYDVLDMGVANVYRETLDSSLRMGADALACLGFRRHQTSRAAKTFRKHDERFLRELAEMRHDENALIIGARERIKALEQLIQAEAEDKYESSDLGWDPTTLVEDFKDFNDKKGIKS
ncbi:MAG: monovalent cation:proton antiporter-2 (CPA2) family protein [Calditrichia bacterium]